MFAIILRRRISSLSLKGEDNQLYLDYVLEKPPEKTQGLRSSIKELCDVEKRYNERYDFTPLARVYYSII